MPPFPPLEAEQRRLSEDDIERLAQVGYLAVCGGKGNSCRDWVHLDPTTQVYYRDLARAVAGAALDDLAKQIAEATVWQVRAPAVDNPWEQVRTRPPRLLEEIRALKSGLDIVEQGCEATLAELETKTNVLQGQLKYDGHTAECIVTTGNFCLPSCRRIREAVGAVDAEKPPDPPTSAADGSLPQEPGGSTAAGVSPNCASAARRRAKAQSSAADH